MPPKITPAARKGIKKAAAKSAPPSCASSAEPTIKSELSTSAPFIKVEEEEKSPSASASVSTSVSAFVDTSTECRATDSEFNMRISPDRFPYTKDDMALHPNGGPMTDLPFTSRSGYWNWMFLPSNLITEPTKDRFSTNHAFPSFACKNKEPATMAKAKGTANPKKTSEPAFTAADMKHYLFPGRRDSESDVSFHHSTQQSKTEKQVRFFKDSTHDKHFVQIPVEPLVDQENWREWMVAMQLLFVQHGVWEVVIGEIKPLATAHPLHVWYQRMRDCAVGLIYANVSEAVRKHKCFLGAAVENDPDALMHHLWVHHGDPDNENPHH